MNNIYRYEITNCRVSVIHTISIGSLMRLAVMSHYGKQNNYRVSKTLSGKNQDGMPLTGHKHVFYIPSDDNYDRYIDHITVMTDTDLTRAESDAIKSINNIYSKQNEIDISIKLCSDSDKDIPMTTSSNNWISATPFVLYRHTKKRGNKWLDTPKDQLVAELERRSFSQHIKNIVMQNKKIMKVSNLRPEQFVRTRKSNESPMSPYEAVLEFDKLLPGPLFLGYGCHFGLGMFMPFGKAND